MIIITQFVLHFPFNRDRNDTVVQKITVNRKTRKVLKSEQNNLIYASKKSGKKTV